MVPFLPLLSCESPVSVKKILINKKRACNHLAQLPKWLSRAVSSYLYGVHVIIMSDMRFRVMYLVYLEDIDSIIFWSNIKACATIYGTSPPKIQILQTAINILVYGCYGCTWHAMVLSVIQKCFPFIGAHMLPPFHEHWKTVRSRGGRVGGVPHRIIGSLLFRKHYIYCLLRSGGETPHVSPL